MPPLAAGVALAARADWHARWLSGSFGDENRLLTSLPPGHDAGKRVLSTWQPFGIVSVITGAAVAGGSRNGHRGLPVVEKPVHLTHSWLTGAAAFVGLVLACLALVRPPRRWGVIGLALNAGCLPLCFYFTSVLLTEAAFAAVNPLQHAPHYLLQVVP